MTDGKPICPHCGSQNTVEIVYGLPGPGTENEPRDYILGGCVIHENSPTNHCCDCGKGFMVGSRKSVKPEKKGLLGSVYSRLICIFFRRF